jgi:hypothetical protein
MPGGKANPSPPLTVAQKTALLDDAVFYEIFFALGVSKHDATNYCVWEHLNFSRMGHARALIYFFECAANSKKWSDDLVSEDFGFRHSRLTLSQADRDRLNKDLFHLSVARLRHNSQTKPWNDNILNQVHERTICFVGFLLSKTRPQDYTVNDSKWRSLLDSLKSGRELLISRSFGAAGVDPGWLVGSGRALQSRLSELTKMQST